MVCNKIQENLVAYLHGELDKKEVKLIHQHLSSCESCLDEELELRKTGRILDKFQFEALPDNFDAELHRKLKPFQKPKSSNKPGIRRIVYAIAATLIITIGLEFFIFQFMQSTEPTIQFTDFPTTQTVFKSASAMASKRTSLKQKYLEKFQQKRVYNNDI
ncbi:zf-HC2 domain-containing protein [candidate division KSB1 bacterium]|nr:zf-HC2 domain-containing protein [candidate division KSB1 bacterium]MBL7093496.1 zf-HC2 domain-containing protein [candidate division KSB1 bacterium]